MHWKSLIYQAILCGTTAVFGFLNLQYFTVCKHIPSTRFQKICQALSPNHIQHVLITAVLGGIASYCCVSLLSNLDSENSTFVGSCFHLENEFHTFFIVLHGSYTGFMFSLKYFICCLYLLKFSLEQKTKSQFIKSQARELLKDSVICVLKAVIWYYLFFFIIGSSLYNSFSVVLPDSFADDSGSVFYSMISPKLFALTIISGVVVFFNWSLYVLVFNTCAVERYTFNIDPPAKTGTNKGLVVALQTPEFDILKCLAVLDLRHLAQFDMERRLKIFAISRPGGHPYQWKSVSEVCMSSLKDLLVKLQIYTLEIAAKETKSENMTGMNVLQGIKQRNVQPPPNFTKKVLIYLHSWPSVNYFFNEIPNAKIRQIFTACQPMIWMTEALGFLVAASYLEDKYGVVQQSLPDIVILLLDLKMAEEKLPIDPIGVKTYVRDPQDRYEHIYQRLALKAAVNGSLCRIASAFKEDVKGIYLPDEYDRYFQRFVNRKNA